MADYASLLHWYDEAALVHWTQAGEELPFWEEAHKRIQQEGWSSKVNHPSAARTTHAIAAPTAALVIRASRKRDRYIAAVTPGRLAAWPDCLSLRACDAESSA